MINREDFITKTYIRKSGKSNTIKYYMNYCDKCGKKRSYMSSPRSNFCISCACIGRVISEQQKRDISASLIGNKNILGMSEEVRATSRVKAIETKRSKIKTQKDMDDRRIKLGAAKLRISVEEYINTQEDRALRKKIAHTARSQIKQVLKGYSGKLRYVHWTINDLMKHLESRFKPGMTWNNYGRISEVECWEIDHIIPLRAKNQDGTYFWKNINDPLSEDFIKCFSLDNLQPLWAKENNIKNNRMEA